jgi:SecD/SecF fusion protein
MKTSPWLLATYVVIIVLGILAALPNVLSHSTLASMPSWLPHERVSLGLDLRGGSHLVLEVDADALVGERLQTLTQDARRTLRDAGIETTAIRRSEERIVVTGRNCSNAVTVE